jgi:hypothetical protein
MGLCEASSVHALICSAACFSTLASWPKAVHQQDVLTEVLQSALDPASRWPIPLRPFDGDAVRTEYLGSRTHFVAQSRCRRLPSRPLQPHSGLRRIFGSCRHTPRWPWRDCMMSEVKAEYLALHVLGVRRNSPDGKLHLRNWANTPSIH